MNSLIHPSAIIGPKAKIHESVSIGPYCIVEDGVELGEGCKLHSHVVLSGIVKAQKNNEFFPFCAIGTPPQDLTYAGEPTEVEVGSNNIFREYVSIHRGTMKDRRITTVGDNCLLMAHVHLGHDVVMGSHCIVANSVNFAGHVKTGDKVIIGGGTNISQFVALGNGAYIGGASGIDRDVPPYCTAFGNRCKLKGINIVGLRRLGVSKEEISAVVDFFRTMETSPLSPRAFVEQDETHKTYLNYPTIQGLAEFIKNSKVGTAPFMS